ncbi:MAG: NAD+ synthase, partial [Candidatus Bipolaricaulota bacterium]|nr:NAD+ synthase [Candidatus Bipolaricaulota bacterium]MDW8152575.1 NAD+ synthase [Candidatus Bipolaricaulota bacterium]
SIQIPLVVGHILAAPERPTNRADPSAAAWQPHLLHNAVFLLDGGDVVGYQAKVRLPSFDVFEEERYFVPGERCEVLAWRGLRLGLSVCEDFWYEDGVLAAQAKSGVDLFINVSASPYFRGKPTIRWNLGKNWAAQAGAPLVYANLVGGQDELLFDGRSFVVRPDGAFLLACPAFEEGLFLADLAGAPVDPPREATWEDLHQALVLGIRDYFQKNGIARAVIGVSGGIDSAVVAALAVEALGQEHVIGAFLPGPFTSAVSWECAQALAENLGIQLLVLPIDAAFEATKAALAPAIPVEGVVAENLQARLRGLFLMALANALGALVLCPGNKAEIGMGYNTLYGDTVGALAPLGDLLKHEVYELARLLNAKAGYDRIPQEILARPPSAELRPNQRDEDDLPPYSVLDPLLRAVVEENASVAELTQRFKPAVVEEVLQRLRRSEYKRRQLPLVLKVSPKAFGMGWRFPVTSGFVG